ncbi:RNA polymerase II-specific transcription factor-like protein [Microdochium nivale]|nr:RNA polymerase II-specific transcription factor-like protein [Microdochium nivale]
MLLLTTASSLFATTWSFPVLEMRRASRHDDEDTAAKRRKVRKGTRSCWECRRRKIRCTFRAGDDTTCDGCRARSTGCISQQFDEAASPDPPDSPLAQRLSRVEDLLERLADQVLPGGSQNRGNITFGATAASSPLTAEPTPTSRATRAIPEPLSPARQLTCDSLLHRISQSTEAVPSVPDILAADDGVHSCKHANISKQLASIYPSAAEIEAVVAAHETAPTIMRYFATNEARVPDDVGSLFGKVNRLGADSHPVLLARQLAQLAHLYQQALVNGHHALVKEQPLAEQAAKMANAVTQLVVSDDDLVGSFEGLETMCLIALYHSNFGNLRKAWLGFRRAITIAQLMGLDRPRDTPIHCIDPPRATGVQKAPDIWFRLNFSDRYNSLLLGMPAANDEMWFLGSMSDDKKSPSSHLERTHCSVSGRIIKRNHTRSIMTTEEIGAIERDLDEAASSMGVGWWAPLGEGPLPTRPSEQMNIIVRAMMQMNHYHLLILLHLPYMMKNVKERQYEHSKAVCMRSCRELLSLFKLFRVEYEGVTICRHTDYTALTASLTLLLGYLDPRMRLSDWNIIKTREADRQLIRDVRGVFHNMAESKEDKLSMEAYKIIGRLVPLAEINQAGTAEAEMAPVTLDIPYLGTINIKPVLRPSKSEQPVQHKNNASSSSMPVLQLSTPPQQAEFATTHQIPKTAASTSSSTVADDDASKWNFLTPPLVTEDSSMLQFTADDGFLPIPDFSADVNQWAFQGFDTAFFNNFMDDLQTGQGTLEGYPPLIGN